ncbi:MAG: CPBP family intramembrane glutamic endopeptidase [Ktedonobacterales bacterium]
MHERKTFLHRHPVVSYFGIAFLLSYGGFVLLDGPKLLRHERIQPSDALLLFPIMVLGVGVAGIALTGILDGRSGLRDLFARMARWRVGVGWYLMLLLPPCLFLAVLGTLHVLVSTIYVPGFFPIGIVFGLVAGFCEEIGWMGFAFPRMQAQQGALAAAVLLGVLWGLWHAPVVDYLGAAAPHGAYWLAFFLDFIALTTALRVLISWMYVNTGSLLLCQLMHASNTGFLAILGPPHISAAQETRSYGLYAAILWVIVVVVVALDGTNLQREPARTS